MSFTHALSPCELHPATLTTLTILTLTLTLSLTFHVSPFTLTFTLAALPAAPSWQHRLGALVNRKFCATKCDPQDAPMTSGASHFIYSPTLSPSD